MMKNKVLSLLCVGALLALSGCCCWRKSSCDRSYDECYDRGEYGMYEDGMMHEGRHSGRHMAPEGDYPRMIEGEYVRPYGENEPECYKPYDGTVGGKKGYSRKSRRMAKKDAMHHERMMDHGMKHDVMPGDHMMGDDMMSHGMSHGG